MNKLDKLILETFGQVSEVVDGKTKKPKDLPKAFKDAIEKKYGPMSDQDFFSDDLTRYMKWTGTDKVTGSVAHKVIILPSFEKMYDEFADIVRDIKTLMRSDDIRKDAAARELFELIRTNFRKLQRYLRTERPDQYALIRNRASLAELHEMFVSHANLILEEKSSIVEANTPRYPEGKLSFGDKVKAIVPLWKQYRSASGMEADKIKDKISRYTAYDNPNGGGSYVFAITDYAKSVKDVAKIIKREEDRLKKDRYEESDYTVKLLVPKVYFNVESGELSDNKNEWYTDDELRAGADQTSYTKGSELDDIVFSGDYDQALDFANRYPNLIKVTKGSMNESLWQEIEEAEEEPQPEEPQPEEAGEETGAVLEDATDTILGRFPTLKAAIVKLQTEDFKEFVDTIDWISPRPTSFRINLKNGQDYILKWTGKTFEAQILGKRYLLSNIAEYQQALDKLAILYKEAPMSGAGTGEPADTDSGGGGGGGGDFPGGEGGAEGGEEGGDVDALAGDDAGGEEGGGADLGGEEIDFEEPAEEPEA